MPAITEFPTRVEQACQRFGEVFANAPERRPFAEYLTGLLIAERKTVSGINAEFVVTTDQSCLNRWLTEVAWDVSELNTRRLEWLQQEPTTRYATQGGLAIDNTLVNHEGELIEDVGWFWDHADPRYVIAHDYLIANYGCPSGKHYALEFRRFRNLRLNSWNWQDHICAPLNLSTPESRRTGRAPHSLDRGRRLSRPIPPLRSCLERTWQPSHSAGYVGFPLTDTPHVRGVRLLRSLRGETRPVLFRGPRS